MSDETRTIAEADESAEQAITSGELVHLGHGVLTRHIVICPRCCQDFDLGTTSVLSPAVCPSCGGETIRHVSMGCTDDESAFVYSDVFNARIEGHVRATINPTFSWELVRARSRLVR